MKGGGKKLRECDLDYGGRAGVDFGWRGAVAIERRKKRRYATNTNSICLICTSAQFATSERERGRKKTLISAYLKPSVRAERGGRMQLSLCSNLISARAG